MLVLGAELRRRGHDVVLGTPPNLVSFAAKAGFEAHPAGPDSQAFLQSAEGQALTWTLFERVAWKAFASDINRVRAWLGLPAVSARFAHREEGKKSLQIQAYSAKVVPALSDYGVDQPIVGFFTPSAEDRRALGEADVDADLQRWLSAGDAPAYFGFGSMPVRDPKAALRMIEGVAQRLGLRALVAAPTTSARSTAPPRPSPSRARGFQLP